jgi:DNA-binding transcriptional MerR regulator
MTLPNTAGSSQAPQQNKTQPTFRAGAVARIAGMPVATLRIWEQRYQAVRPSTAASGHRLYSPADVERATLLRRLTAQGHAIGLLASLETDQMQEMMRAPEVTQANWVEAHLQSPIKIVVVGQSLASRVQRLFYLQPFGLKVQLVGVFDSLAASAKAAGQSDEPTADILILQTGSLQTGVHQELRTAQDAWRAPSVAVFYRFSSAAARSELTNAGVEVYSEPSDDNSLRQWLATLQNNVAQGRKTTDVRHSTPPVSVGLGEQTVSPPLFDDAALTQFAGLSTTVACECPSHLAELLLQVSSFEKYSSECANRSAADARLHAYLQHVAGSARMLFEKALEQIAIAEGLHLPSSPTASSN